MLPGFLVANSTTELNLVAHLSLPFLVSVIKLKEKNAIEKINIKVIKTE